MGDEHHCGAGLDLKLLDESEDLSLDGHVEGRCGLVGDEQPGSATQTDGNHYSLAHAARHLVGVLTDSLVGLGYTDQIEHFSGPGHACLPV